MEFFVGIETRREGIATIVASRMVKGPSGRNRNPLRG